MEKDIASYIDATVLKATAQRSDIVALCKEARTHEFACVCVSGQWASLCVHELEGCATRVCSVVGFPLGNESSACKAREAQHLVTQGVTEIDMVVSLGAYFSQDYDYVLQEIRAVREAIGKASNAVKNTHALLKVIIETCYLLEEDIVRLCEMCISAGAEFVKTSTGFGDAGATVEHVRLMKRVVGKKARVKAAGGIRNYATARAMIEAGADRIGTSAGVDIVQMRAAENADENKGKY